MGEKITNQRKHKVNERALKNKDAKAQNEKGAKIVKKKKLVIYKNNAGGIERIFNPTTNQFLKGTEFEAEKNKVLAKLDNIPNFMDRFKKSK